MPLIILILGLIIAIVVLTIKYIRINAHVLSRDEFHSAALKRAAKLEREDPIISCDYCGAKIDTRVNKVCPQCGASFSTDEEWKIRHAENKEWIERNSKKFAASKLKEATRQSAKTARGLKITIMALVTFVVALSIFAVIFDRYLKERHRFQDNEILNQNSYESYVKTEYEVDGDNTIFDKNGVKVSLTGFYVSDYDYEDEIMGEPCGRVKLEYVVENKSDYDVRVSFRGVCVNGISSDGIFHYEWYRKKSKTTLYEELYKVRGKKVKDISFNQISLFYDDYDRNTFIDGMVRFSTTADYTYNMPELKGDLKYENTEKGIKIFTNPSDDGRGYDLYVSNESDINYEMTSSDLTINGETDQYNQILEDPLIGNSVYAGRIMSIKYDSIIGKELTFSMSFTSTEDPSKNFATGYININ